VELRQLHLFVTLAEELHFRRAAEQAHIAQPALSDHIRRIERELGVQLFERTSHYVRLTDAGRLFLHETRKALVQVDRAVEVAQCAARGELGALRVGLGGLVGSEITSRLLRTFSSRYPAVRLTLREAELGDPSAGLHGCEVDVAVLRLPVDRQDRLELTVLLSESAVAIMADDHPLVGRGAVPMQELARSPFVAAPTSAGVTRDFWLGEPDADGRSREIAAEARTVEELLETIAASDAVALVPASSQRFHARPGIAFANVPDVAPSVVAVARRRGDQSPLARAFAGLAAEVAGGCPQLGDSAGRSGDMDFDIAPAGSVGFARRAQHSFERPHEVPHHRQAAQ
jgi:DNA-binding transcriptional LysR family regulator